MGVEWGGKGPESPVKEPLSEPLGRFMLRPDILDAQPVVEAVAPGADVTATEAAPIRPLLTDSQMLDSMKPEPKPALRRANQLQ